MDPEIVIELEGVPPSLNHAFVIRKSKKSGQYFPVMTTPARKYQEMALDAAQRGLESGWRWRGAWVRLLFQLYTPTAIRSDLSNTKKILEDGIAKGLKVNDKWFLWTDLIPKVDKIGGGRCVISVYQDPEAWVVSLREDVYRRSLYCSRY